MRLVYLRIEAVLFLLHFLCIQWYLYELIQLTLAFILNIQLLKFYLKLNLETARIETFQRTHFQQINSRRFIPIDDDIKW